jgi:hypothetical protein
VESLRREDRLLLLLLQEHHRLAGVLEVAKAG